MGEDGGKHSHSEENCEVHADVGLNRGNEGIRRAKWAEVEVNEEELELRTEGETQYEEEGGDLHVE